MYVNTNIKYLSMKLLTVKEDVSYTATVNIERFEKNQSVNEQMEGGNPKKRHLKNSDTRHVLPKFSDIQNITTKD